MQTMEKRIKTYLGFLLMKVNLNRIQFWSVLEASEIFDGAF